MLKAKITAVIIGMLVATFGMLATGTASASALPTIESSSIVAEISPAYDEVGSVAEYPVDGLYVMNDFEVGESYLVQYTRAQTLEIDLDTTQLFKGAQLIIDALSSPYLLIAGLGLGVAILAAILKAVTSLRL